MPLVTRVVTLGAVGLTRIVGGGPPENGSVVVGDPPQWSDGSHDTYAALGNAGGDDDMAVAPFDSVAPSATVLRSVEVSAVISATGAPVTARPGLLSLSGSGEAADFEVSGDGVPRTYSAALDLAAAAAALVEGGNAVFIFNQSGTGGEVWATCYELTLTVTLWAGSPPRRIFPRDDGLMGGAPRVFPASKGYQSGNRAAGGYV